MDIQHLITEARESMLSSGNVMPMIYLELSGSPDAPQGRIIMMALLDILSDSQSIPMQCGVLARLGWEECKKYPGEKPVAASFYAEYWIASEPDSNEKRMRPKLDPKRREVIMVETWQSQGNQCQSYKLPVIRDKKRRVVDVGAPEGPKDKVSWQLASFAQGVHDSQKPDEEVMSKMENTIKQRIARMSPEKRRELMEFVRQEGLVEGLEGLL